MDDPGSIEIRLALAVNGPYDATETSVADLLWKASEHRRQITAAHHELDMMGAPRDNLTLAGRLQILRYREET